MTGAISSLVARSIGSGVNQPILALISLLTCLSLGKFPQFSASVSCLLIGGNNTVLNGLFN